jgi:hypothetical protein
VVARETPAGAGFGAAELKLADRFLLVPTVVAGKLVPIGAVTIPIAWTVAATKGGHQAWDPRDLAPVPDRAVGIKYRRVPHGLDYVGSYPASAYDARLPGWATVACRATAKGQLRDCTVVEENPPGNGFGRAALKWVQAYFLLEPQADDGASVEGIKITTKVSWSMDGVEYFAPHKGQR